MLIVKTSYSVNKQKIFIWKFKKVHMEMTEVQTICLSLKILHVYRVHQQKPDAQNFNSKKHLKNRFKTHK